MSDKTKAETKTKNLKKRKELSDYEIGMVVGGALHGIPLSAISEKTGIPKSTVHNTVQRWRQNGTGITEKRKGRAFIFDERAERHLKNEMKRNPDAKLADLTAFMRESIGHTVSPRTVQLAILRIGMTLS
ncbi:Homeodomain-like DNA binding domain-containing transcription factor [Phycomyces blakesleeanus NRRL 1555(-)]|uniref:Homeodomain-like DNA binding domain-containing transcription factor n=1 Tax=Phycomyces blakesleeanus (strain ATCC 8743b / DSM 1359 / FGSC 10004 / NBRC 33097 / NRRL 1555) TaxID=763407 RepID=A0A163EAD7_PHYB8|nr:Homeodomain-like DNA binding domain-containing transcription factor [Phycomyces blakesleeanus NRRL 1555(-)]OAD77640.1 Homeodomain-like DNA binding domain-containing transcription factor [Phycomyces blakesleeanus NRRL 1555(-)]|eukprot:XP_018295680.1 Homeodomain-like DNA binding domain-containing transcription factor [Phycomyces blakesleeanus NRRL 1555(-)]